MLIIKPVTIYTRSQSDKTKKLSSKIFLIPNCLRGKCHKKQTKRNPQENVVFVSIGEMPFLSLRSEAGKREITMSPHCCFHHWMLFNTVTLQSKVQILILTSDAQNIKKKWSRKLDVYSKAHLSRYVYPLNS